MKVQVLNGYSRVSPNKTAEGRRLNGFSRVNALNGIGFTLNGFGYALNGAAVEANDSYYIAELINDAMEGDPDAIIEIAELNGFGYSLNGRAERRARREKRRARREARRARKEERQQSRAKRREQRAQRRELRNQKLAAKIENIKSGEGFGNKLLDVGRSVVENLTGDGDAFIEDAMTIGRDFAGDYLGDVFPPGMDLGANQFDEKGLFSPPSLFKSPGKWFSSNRVPTWQKIAVVAGAALAADQLLLKGKFTKKIIGKK